MILKRRRCCNYDKCNRALRKSNKSGYCYYHYKIQFNNGKIITMKKREKYIKTKEIKD